MLPNFSKKQAYSKFKEMKDYWAMDHGVDDHEHDNYEAESAWTEEEVGKLQQATKDVPGCIPKKERCGYMY
jgi:serine/threonine-protein kinase RIO1